MSQKVYEYNEVEGNTIKIKKELKKKGKDYGFFTVTKSQFKILMDAIDLMSSSPDISPKFSEKLESYLHPRFNEIFSIITMNKSLPDQIKIETSKENHKEVLIGINLPSVLTKLLQDKGDIANLIKSLKEMKTEKFKG